jgi:hypothetical protein
MSEELPEGVTKASEFSCSDGLIASPLNLDVPFVRHDGSTGMIPCVKASGTAFNLIVQSGGGYAVLALAVPGPFGSLGIFAPYAAAELRDYAASFLRVADLLDQGKGKQ